MIIREKYIAEVRGFYKSDLIKIITGVRRCGKSVILEQIMNEIRSVSGNIVYLDFDDRAVTSSIETWQDIVRYVQEKRTDGLCYVFLDEVQEIEGWPAACRSLRRENCSVFITGSNSKLLSREFTSELSGRYVSFRVRPFVYRELLEYGRELGRDVSVTDYLIWEVFPSGSNLVQSVSSDGISMIWTIPLSAATSSGVTESEKPKSSKRQPVMS